MYGAFCVLAALLRVLAGGTAKIPWPCRSFATCRWIADSRDENKGKRLGS